MRETLTNIICPVCQETNTFLQREVPEDFCKVFLIVSFDKRLRGTKILYREYADVHEKCLSRFYSLAEKIKEEVRDMQCDADYSAKENK